MRYLLVILALVFTVSCGGGGGGGGGGSDLSCAPAEADRVTPTVDLDGSWNLYLDETSSTCDYPPSYITCPLTMSVSTNTVTITGSCTTSDGVSVTIVDMPGIVSGDTLYWGATMTGSVGTYSETDTVPCTDVAFTSGTQSESFSVTVTVVWTDVGEGDTCATTFTGDFTAT